MMGASTLIDRLEGVRKTGHGRWLARCPAHEDKRPSLSIRELDDGRVLAHCFAGCSIEDVVAAAGIDLGDLFPPRPIERARRERRPFDARDVLAVTAAETRLVAVAAANLRAGVPLNDDDHARLMLAAERLATAEALT
jgi:hypothetical protein